LQTEQKNSMCCLLVTFRAILMFQEGCIWENATITRRT
jgi:hypothetical protein